MPGSTRSGWDSRSQVPGAADSSHSKGFMISDRTSAMSGCYHGGAEHTIPTDAILSGRL